MEEMLKPGFLASVADSGTYLSGRLRDLVSELGLSHERGMGILRSLDLVADLGWRFFA